MDPKELLACAKDTTVEGRRKLAGAVSQFFEDHTLSEKEQSIASEILLNLIRQAETDLREALSERLSVQENVPPELIVFLANDEISVARHVLARSPVLNDIDLIYIIASKGAEHWQVIADRPALTPVVTDRLIDTSDPSTMMRLIDNQRTHLQRSSIKKLIRVTLQSEELQAPLLRRPEIDGDTAIDLYMVASQALREEIVKQFPVPAHVVDQAVESLLHELSQAAREKNQTTAEMEALARKFNERKDISSDLMIRVLRRGQIGFFVALFSQKSGLQPHHVIRMIQKDGGKPFVVACRAMGMMKSEFASIFLLSRGIRTGDKIVDQRELAMALKYFDAIKEFDVQRIMKSWVKTPELIG